MTNAQDDAMTLEQARAYAEQVREQRAAAGREQDARDAAAEQRRMDRRSGNGAEHDAMEDAAERYAEQRARELAADARRVHGYDAEQDGPREYLMLPLELKDAAAPYWYSGWECEGTAPDVRRAFPGVEDGEPVYLYFSRPLGFATGMGFGAEQQRARLASGLIFAADVSALLQGYEGTLLERVRDARADWYAGHDAE